jgi:hypothetical protein
MRKSFPVVLCSAAITVVMLVILLSSMRRTYWPQIGVNERSQTGATEAPRSLTSASAASCDWSRIESDDLPTYIENLRRCGCPEDTVKDIIIAKVCRIYLPRLQKTRDSAWAYWQRGQGNSLEADRRFRELLQERNALIRSLLGVNLDGESEDGENSSDPQLSFLPKTKAAELRSIEQGYGEQTDRIIAASGGLMTPEDRDALDALKQQKSADIGRLLTPGETLEYDLRNSSLAQKLRNELDAFEPSEGEFRAIYQAEAALQSNEAAATNSPEQHGVSDGPTTEEQLRSALGEERYAEYQRSKDPGYQCLLKVADRYGLPTDAAVQVFDLKQSTEAQCAEVVADPQYTSEQKQAWLRSVHDQVGATLVGILGDKGFGVYHDYAGSWIDKLGR